MTTHDGNEKNTKSFLLMLKTTYLFNVEIKKYSENIFVPDEVASYHSISTFFALFFLFIFYMTHTVMIQ